MKILHIINTLAIGGAQSVLIQLIKGWGDEGDQHMVISLRQPEQLSEQIEALNISIEHINLLPNKIDPGKFLRLVHIIKNYQPDLVQTWLYHADLIGSIAARFAGHAPIVWGIHHTTLNKHSVKSSTWKVVQLLSRLSKHFPSHIICCSEATYQTHLGLGYPGNKITIIVNGVDTDRFRPDSSARAALRKELGLSSQAKLIGMFARFHHQKDYDTLIHAAGIFLKRNPNVHFVLAGAGIDNSNKQLQDNILQEGIQNNLHLLGIRHDMPYLNASMDIATLSSSYGEALPMTLCEAMSCAIPCVATNVGDTAALIGDTGIVVDPKNPQALANAWQDILKLSEIEYNYLGYQARQKIVRSYNLENMISYYKQIYRRSIDMDITI